MMPGSSAFGCKVPLISNDTERLRAPHSRFKYKGESLTSTKSHPCQPLGAQLSRGNAVSQGRGTREVTKLLPLLFNVANRLKEKVFVRHLGTLAGGNWAMWRNKAAHEHLRLQRPWACAAAGGAQALSLQRPDAASVWGTRPGASLHFLLLFHLLAPLRALVLIMTFNCSLQSQRPLQGQSQWSTPVLASVSTRAPGQQRWSLKEPPPSTSKRSPSPHFSTAI